MPKVLIGSPSLQGIEGEYRSVLRDAGFEVLFADHQLTEAELIGHLAGCEAALPGTEPYTRRVLEAHPQLRLLVRSGVGYDNIDVAAATERGIVVAIAPGNAAGVAEHTFALMLALVKDLRAQNDTIRAGRWPRRTLPSLRGATLAIAGLGRVGKQVALRAKAFVMRVIAYDPVWAADFAKEHGIEWRSFDDLFIEGDYVSLHMPLNDETRGCVGARHLGRMKSTAYLINTARGGIVNEQELHDVLHDRRIAGAGLDVFENEPPVGSSFLKLDNVVLTAHVAGIDERSRVETALLAAKTVVGFWRGEWPGELVVNPEVSNPVGQDSDLA